mmetsp:Transcript_4984/g.10859  ORF Transcript_4984/g.10859 Transcript_4984/m.10859 type:complete len:585 (+) Transcript_4984:278-2032(+)
MATVTEEAISLDDVLSFLDGIEPSTSDCGVRRQLSQSQSMQNQSDLFAELANHSPRAFSSNGMSNDSAAGVSIAMQLQALQQEQRANAHAAMLNNLQMAQNNISQRSLSSRLQTNGPLGQQPSLSQQLAARQEALLGAPSAAAARMQQSEMQQNELRMHLLPNMMQHLSGSNEQTIGNNGQNGLRPRFSLIDADQLSRMRSNSLGGLSMQSSASDAAFNRSQPILNVPQTQQLMHAQTQYACNEGQGETENSRRASWQQGGISANGLSASDAPASRAKPRSFTVSSFDPPAPPPPAKEMVFSAGAPPSKENLLPAKRGGVRSKSTPGKDGNRLDVTSSQGASHICMWPDCGKGFASMWALQRHVHNHQQAQAEEAEDADSFVERRLRERLKSVEVALERTKERLAQSQRQEDQAESELLEARTLSAQQEAEIAELAKANQRLAQRLATEAPSVARELLGSTPLAFSGLSAECAAATSNAHAHAHQMGAHLSAHADMNSHHDDAHVPSVNLNAEAPSSSTPTSEHASWPSNEQVQRGFFVLSISPFHVLCVRILKVRASDVDGVRLPIMSMRATIFSALRMHYVS